MFDIRGSVLRKENLDARFLNLDRAYKLLVTLVVVEVDLLGVLTGVFGVIVVHGHVPLGRYEELHDVVSGVIVVIGNMQDILDLRLKYCAFGFLDMLNIILIIVPTVSMSPLLTPWKLNWLFQVSHLVNLITTMRVILLK